MTLYRRAGWLMKKDGSVRESKRAIRLSDLFQCGECGALILYTGMDLHSLYHLAKADAE